MLNVRHLRNTTIPPGAAERKEVLEYSLEVNPSKAEYKHFRIEDAALDMKCR